MPWSEQQEAIFAWFGGAREKHNLVVRARAGCLAGDTILNINRAGKGSPMPIEKVVAQFNGTPPLVYRPDLDCYQRMRPWERGIETRIARADDDRVRLGTIADAWCSGVKTTYTLTTDSGRSVRATNEHPFLLENGEWVPLGALSLGARVRVNVGQGGTERGKKPMYLQSDTKYHPYQVGNGKRRWKVATHRLIVEAEMNDLDFGEYIDILRNRENIAVRLLYLKPTQVVHHKDGDELNNDFDNLLVLSNVRDHSEQHDWGANVLARIGVETVVSIEMYGEEPTYDISVADDPHCFLANGFVVHNTGKTTTIVEALNHINWTIGAGERGLVCAFNKRIAEELNARLAKVQKVEAKTLHSLGYQLLRDGWTQGLRVDDKVERERVENAIPMIGRRPYVWECITQTVKLMSFAKSVDPFVNVDKLETIAIRRGLDHADPTGEWDATWMARVARLAMDASKVQDPALRISFDDMIFVPAALGFTAPLYDWIVVDEAQDMSAAQLIVAKAALKPGGHMVIVGDDRQAIYGFRGADTGCIDRLKRELDAEEMGLNTTYRCPKSVVNVARKLVGDFRCPDEAPEGQVISGTRDDVLEKAKPGDAILSRTNAPLVPLCLAFIRKNIAAKIEGRDIGKMLVERAKSKSLKSETVEEFCRKLGAWVGKATSRALGSGKEVEEKLQNIEDVRATLEAIADDCETMDEFYDRCNNLFADVDQNGTKQFVILSTVHKAKGLEWDRVFILRNTLYVNGARTDDPEERNIHYVAVTRSKSALMMVGDGEDE